MSGIAQRPWSPPGHGGHFPHSMILGELHNYAFFKAQFTAVQFAKNSLFHDPKDHSYLPTVNPLAGF